MIAFCLTPFFTLLRKFQGNCLCNTCNCYIPYQAQNVLYQVNSLFWIFILFSTKYYQA